MKQTRRKTILATVSDLVSDFLYYDRKEDDDLSRGDIEAAIKAGEITAAEIIEKFAKSLRAGLGDPHV